VFYDNLEELPVSFQEWGVDPRSLVILAHSQAGAGAIAAVTGVRLAHTLVDARNCSLSL
jgi:hypothetical protein